MEDHIQVLNGFEKLTETQDPRCRELVLQKLLCSEWDIMEEFSTTLTSIPEDEFEAWLSLTRLKIHSYLFGIMPIFQDKYAYPTPIVRYVFASLFAPLPKMLPSVWQRFPNLALRVRSEMFLDDEHPFQDLLKQARDAKQLGSKLNENVVTAIVKDNTLYPSLIMKIMDDDCKIEDEIKTLKINLEFISKEGTFDNYYGLLTSLKTNIFVKYSKTNHRFVQSKEFEVSAKAEFFDKKEYGDDWRTVQKLVVCALIKSMPDL